MAERETGGPAFPTVVASHRDGMTLRDYFAAQLAAHQDVRFVAKVYPRGKGQPNEVQIPPFEWDEPVRRAIHAWIAKDAYALADALLAERAK